MDIGLGDGGLSLKITGDHGGNQIDILQDESGLHVTADHGRMQTFNGIQKITLATGAGDDVVTIRSIIDPNIRSIIDPNFHGVDFTADLGASDDTFNSNISAHSPPSEHAPPSDRIAVLGGAGNDAFHSLISSGDSALVPAVRNESVDLRFDGGQGENTALASADIDTSGWFSRR